MCEVLVNEVNEGIAHSPPSEASRNVSSGKHRTSEGRGSMLKKPAESGRFLASCSCEISEIINIEGFAESKILRDSEARERSGSGAFREMSGAMKST